MLIWNRRVSKVPKNVWLKDFPIITITVRAIAFYHILILPLKHLLLDDADDIYMPVEGFVFIHLLHYQAN